MMKIDFREARRRVSYRNLFATDCKIDTLPANDFYEDNDFGLLAAPYELKYTPVYVAGRVLCRSRNFGNIVGGGWTNGYAVLCDAIKIKSSRINYICEDKQLLFESGEAVRFACVIYYWKTQNDPVACLVSENYEYLFCLEYLDCVLSLAANLSDFVGLRFNSGNNGVLPIIYNEVAGYLGRLKFPREQESILQLHARRYYEICRNRPKSG